MKNFFTFILLIFSQVLFNQNSEKRSKIDKFTYSNNSEIQIFYTDFKKNKKKQTHPCYFVNGIFLENPLLESIPSKGIESFSIKKENYNINGSEYYGKILIELRKEYSASFITLKEFISKRLKLDQSPLILQIDGKNIESYKNESIINENYILKINVNKIKTSEDELDLYIINLITRSKENIKKANQPKIIIRGGLDYKL